MDSSTFKLVNQTTYRVGGRELSCSYCNPLFKGKFRYIADGTSDERDSVADHLFIHDFCDTHPTDLPNGISITIVSPKSEFRQVDFARIEKVEDKAELTITLGFLYADWHLPISLPHFLERYRDALLRQVGNASQANIENSEVGFFLSCAVVVQPSVDFWSAYQESTSQILSTYRKCLAELFGERQQPKAATIQKSEGISGARWWFQYVIVPVLGSGAVAAIAAGLMAFVK